VESYCLTWKSKLPCRPTWPSPIQSEIKALCEIRFWTLKFERPETLMFFIRTIRRNLTSKFTNAMRYLLTWELKFSIWRTSCRYRSITRDMCFKLWFFREWDQWRGLCNSWLEWIRRPWLCCLILEKPRKNINNWVLGKIDGSSDSYNVWIQRPSDWRNGTWFSFFEFEVSNWRPL